MSQELDAVQQFASAVGTTTTAAEVDGILTTRARGRHFRTQIKVLKRAYEDAEAAGLPPSVVPVKVLAPLLEHAGLEEEDDQPMIDRWGHLLANAATASPAHVPPAFPDILRQLEPLDALILEAMDREQRRKRTTSERDVGACRSAIAGLVGVDFELVGQARIDNLMRLELLRPLLSRSDQPTTWGDLKLTGYVMLTELGAAFVAACRRPAAE